MEHMHALEMASAFVLYVAHSCLKGAYKKPVIKTAMTPTFRLNGS